MLVAQHRREVAKFKRLLKGREKKIALLEGRENARLAKPVASQSTLTGGAFSTKSVRALRNRLRLSVASQPSSLANFSACQSSPWQRGMTPPAQ